MLSDVNKSCIYVLKGEGGWGLFVFLPSSGPRKQIVVLLAVQNYVFGEEEASFCHSTYVSIPWKMLVH